MNRRGFVPVRAAVLLTVLALLASCATPQKGQVDMTASGSIVWPGPPEKERIKYLWSLSKLKADETPGTGLTDVLAGRSGEDVTDPQYSNTLLRPQGIYADEKRLYIADPGAARVTVVDRQSMDVLEIREADGVSLEYPISAVSGADGRIYVADPELKKVFVYTEGGKFVSSFEGAMERPTGLAVDRRTGVIYIVDTLGHCVYVYDSEGRRKGRIGKRGEGDGEFNFPSHAFVDQKGNLYVTDFLNFRVQIFSPDGRFAAKLGVLGDSYDSLEKPKGVAVDKEGHIYIVDAGKDMVKIFDRDGGLLLAFGETGHRYGDFYLPTGIFIDHQDMIYVADTVNRRIQVFQFLGGE